MRRKVIAVIYGGRSGEHEVSLVSGRAVLGALREAGFRAISVLVGKDGRWKAGEKGRPGPIRFEQGMLNGIRLDAAFPIVHGTYGEDGRLQGLLDMAGIPYVGCGVEASAICMDKDMTKRLLAGAGIPVAEGAVILEREWRTRREDALRRTAREAGYPCFVKPSRLGSSVGVSKVKRKEDLPAALRRAFRYDEKVLVERAVPNAREIEIAVLGNDPYRVSGPGEVVPAGEFYDFYDKYVDGRAGALIPAPLDRRLARTFRDAAVTACRTLGVEGMARVDFLLEKGTRRWVLNELNTLPGFTSISMYPKLWQSDGLSFPHLAAELVRLAIERSRRRKLTDFSSGTDWYA